jgi:uncharacterized membrane protein
MSAHYDFSSFALSKTNLILIVVGLVFIVIGFILMTGSPSTEAAYNPDIFSFRRIVLAPGVALAGFLVVLFGILYNKKDRK